MHFILQHWNSIPVDLISARSEVHIISCNVMIIPFKDSIPPKRILCTQAPTSYNIIGIIRYVVPLTDGGVQGPPSCQTLVYQTSHSNGYRS